MYVLSSTSANHSDANEQTVGCQANKETNANTTYSIYKLCPQYHLLPTWKLMLMLSPTKNANMMFLPSFLKLQPNLISARDLSSSITKQGLVLTRITRIQLQCWLRVFYGVDRPKSVYSDIVLRNLTLENAKTCISHLNRQ